MRKETDGRILFQAFSPESQREKVQARALPRRKSALLRAALMRAAQMAWAMAHAIDGDVVRASRFLQAETKRGPAVVGFRQPAPQQLGLDAEAVADVFERKRLVAAAREDPLMRFVVEAALAHRAVAPTAMDDVDRVDHHREHQALLAAQRVR